MGTQLSQRAFVVAILDDFEQIACLIGGERFGPPIIQDEQSRLITTNPAGDSAGLPSPSRLSRRKQ